MASWVKVLAIAGSLRLISRTYMVEGENGLQQAAL